LAASIDQRLMGVDHGLGCGSTNWNGCGTSGCGTSGDGDLSFPTWPERPTHQLPLEIALNAQGILGSSSGTGTGSGSSSIDVVSSSANAIIGGVFMLPPSILEGRIYAEKVRDIPPAPAVELLRPPQVLT